MGIKPSMTFLLIKGFKTCYLEGASHPELYLQIRPDQLFLLNLKLLEIRFYLKMVVHTGSASALFCCYISP